MLASGNLRPYQQNESQPRLDSIQMNSSKTVAPKRLSIIDRGKSWARQLMKNSKILQRSIESHPSGIDSSTKINTTVSSYSIKMSLPDNLLLQNEPQAETKSPLFSSHLKVANDTYDQVYSSPSNSNSSALSSTSSSSSSGYLMSPLDESGYLVPIVNLVNCCNDSFQKTEIKPAIISLAKDMPTNSADTVAQLTRSQSTRSAYTSCSSNLTSSSSFYSQFNGGHHQNRATICEQHSDEKAIEYQKNVCIKCNCRLDKSKQNVNNNVHFEQNEEDLAKSNRVYNLLESFACNTCLLANSDNKKSIIPSNPPPPLPLLPPPSLSKSLLISNNTNVISNSTNTNTNINSNNNINKQNNTFTVIKNNLNQHRHTIILVANNKTNSPISDIHCNEENINQILKTLNQNRCLNSSNLVTDSNIKITPLVICTQNPISNNNNNNNNSNNSNNNHSGYTFYNKSHKYTVNNNLIDSRSGELKHRNSNEPIIYIDSIDELETYSISSSISSLSSISSPDKSSQSDSYSIDMNQLLARLKHTTKNLNSIQHRNKSHLTPSNSVESFEFIADTTAATHGLETSASYEKSWDHTRASALLDKLGRDSTDNAIANSSIFLASSLIEIANQQNQSHQTVDDNVLRYRKLKSSAPAVRRISFPLPIQKISSFRDFEKLTSIPSSTNCSHVRPPVTTSPIPVVKTSRIILNNASSPSSKTFNNSTSSDDMEQLISVPSLVHKNEHSSSYRNVKVACNQNNNSSSNKSYTNSSGSSNRYSYVPSNNSNGKYDALPESFNSSSEELNDATWFQPNMPRENVQIFLSNKEIGSFVIRLSNTCRDCFALSIRVPYFANQNGIAHYLIVRHNKGYKLKGVDKEFKSLKSLVTHYSVMQEILPVTLNLSTIYNNINQKTKSSLIETSQVGICRN